MSEDFPWWAVAVATLASLPFVGLAVTWALSSPSPSGEISGSRANQGIDATDDIKEILRKIEPIDSLYFDVSVARHQLEEGDTSKALHWLDPNHALGELRKSQEANFLTPQESESVLHEIWNIKSEIEQGRLAAAHSLIAPLQNRLAEKAYTTFKELDPIPEGYIDGRYTAAREKKVSEWRTKGYPEALIEKTLKWADEWSRGIARRFIKDPVMQAQVEQSIYPEALELSERFIEAMAK